MTLDPERFKALAVRLQNRQIGVINRLAGDRQLFSFDEDYLNDPARPTLSLSFKGGQGTVAHAPRTYSARVPPFFSNLLPEGHLRTYLAAHAGVKPEREFFLLAALGADLPGGLVVAPLADEGEAADSPETPLHDHRDAEPAEPALRFSLAGVQLKFSAILEASGGLTIPAGGMGGSWIVKLPSERFPSVPENEFVMLELARMVGITVPPNRLIPAAQITGLPRDAARLDGNALAVKRFDRSDGKRVHMEDFAQVFGLFPEEKYDKRSYANIAAVLWAETGEQGTYEFLRRLVFSVVIGNGDMHLKNWSLLYPDGRTPELSPAYDFVSTVPYMPDGEKLGLTFGDSRSLSGITKDQVRRFADRARLPTSPLWEIVRDTVARTTEAWNALDARELLPAEINARVQSQIETAARGTER